jgi:hypothetical protein
MALLCAFAAPAAATVITVDFDSVPPVTNNSQAGNTFAGSGVVFSTLSSISDTVSPGGTIFTSPFSNTFWLIANTDAVSEPNFAAATNGGANEVLMAFDGVVTSIAVQTDDASEGSTGDVVRLLGLTQTGVNQFLVTAIASGLDNEISAPGNILSLSSISITHAIFQTTTEQEGFDNLTFDLTRAAPEPATLWILGLGALGVGWVRHRRF